MFLVLASILLLSSVSIESAYADCETQLQTTAWSDLVKATQKSFDFERFKREKAKWLETNFPNQVLSQESFSLPTLETPEDLLALTEALLEKQRSMPIDLEAFVKNSNRVQRSRLAGLLKKFNPQKGIRSDTSQALEFIEGLYRLTHGNLYSWKNLFSKEFSAKSRGAIHRRISETAGAHGLSGVLDALSVKRTATRASKIRKFMKKDSVKVAFFLSLNTLFIATSGVGALASPPQVRWLKFTDAEIESAVTNGVDSVFPQLVKRHLVRSQNERRYQMFKTLVNAAAMTIVALQLHGEISAQIEAHDRQQQYEQKLADKQAEQIATLTNAINDEASRLLGETDLQRISPANQAFEAWRELYREEHHGRYPDSSSNTYKMMRAYCDRQAKVAAQQ